MMTGKMTTIARPYATAAFEYASAEKSISSWEALLDSAALVTADVRVQQLLSDPAITSVQLASLYSDVLEQMLDTEKTAFIRLLAENHRLAVLPEIAALFKSYRQAQEKIVTVEVTSAIPLGEAYQRKLSAALERRLQRQVSLQCQVDASLSGGAIIRAGDMVIDGSVRGKLNRMFEFIS